MANIVGELHCCSDCAMLIANNDTSGTEYYGADYYAKWCDGMAANRGELPDGNPVIACPEDCPHENAREFNCDWCGRNVFSHKFDLSILN